MLIDIHDTERSWRELYHLFIGFVTPRPIALVSTVSPDGKHNLAPYSFFNMVCGNPPVVMFCPGRKRDGGEKDSFVNARETGAFVVATVVEPMARQMVDAACALPYGASEFDFTKLTPAPASRVAAPLVKEAPVNMECRLRDIYPINDQPGGTNVVFGDVLAIHVDEAILNAEGRIDPQKLATVGRLGGNGYCVVKDAFELEIPPPPDGA